MKTDPAVISRPASAHEGIPSVHELVSGAAAVAVFLVAWRMPRQTELQLNLPNSVPEVPLGCAPQ
jgi:hypothetical protein